MGVDRARLLADNIELDDAVKPAHSHVALNTVTEPDGTERQILRENMPFGSLGRGEYGTYFLGYARTPAVTEKMLENMFVGSPPGTYDRILDFSTAVTGTLFFAPSADFLDELPDPPARPEIAVADRAVTDSLSTGTLNIGTLNIGTLRRSTQP